MRCKLLKVSDRWALPTVPRPCAEKLFEIDKKQKCPPVRMDTAVAARSEPAARLPLEHARRLRAEAGELREVGVGPAHLGWGRKVPYYAAPHTTLHTALHLNKNRETLRQRKNLGAPRAQTF